MNRSNTLTVFAFLALASSFAFAQETGGQEAAKETVTFKRTYVEGQVEKYRIVTQTTSNTDLSSVGQDVQAMNFDTSMDAMYTYKKVKEDGTALLNFLLSNIVFKADGPMADMMGQMGDEAPKEIKGTQEIDPFLKITNTKFEGANTSMMQMMGGGSNMADIFSFVSFPTKPVAIGDTWESDVPSVDGMFEKGAKLTVKFVGAGEFDGAKTWILQYAGKPKMTIDIGKRMAENPSSGAPAMNIVLEANTSVGIKVAVDQATFQILSIDSATDTDGKVKLVDMGMEFPSTGQQVSKVVIKKDAAK